MGRVSTVLVCCVVLVLAVAEEASSQWVPSTGLDNAIVSCMASVGTDLFAGTSDGVFCSTDRGVSWFAASEGLSDRHVQALARVDTVLYAGTYTGLFCSADRGRSWIAVAPGLAGVQIRSLVATDSVIIAGTLRGVFRSADRGLSWAAVDGFHDSPAGTFAGSGNSLLAGTGEGIYRSADAGLHWSQVSNITPRTIGTSSAQVSFVFDDSYPSHYSALKPIFTAHKVPAVLAVIVNTINTSQGISAAHLQELESYGWELASHTVHHIKLTTLPVDSMAWELRESQRLFAEYGLKTPETIVYPGGAENQAVDDTAARYYTAGVVSWDGLNKPTAPRMQIRRFDADNSFGLATYKNAVDAAMAGGLWCVFMMHDIDSVEKAIMLDSLISYIQSRQVPIVTMQQGLVGVTSFTSSNSTLFAGTSDGVYRLSGDTTGWQAKNNGFTSGRPIVSTFVSYSGTLYAAMRAGVYTSTDAGETWKTMNVGLTNTFVTSMFVAGNTLLGGTYGNGIWRYPLPEIVQNHAPLPATRLRPGVLDTVQMFSSSYQTSSFQSTPLPSIQFQWLQAPDPDRDSLSYRWHLWGASLDTTVPGLRDTMMALSLSALEPGQQYAWTVETSDGKLRVASDTARFCTVLLVENHAPVAAARLRPGAGDTLRLCDTVQAVQFDWHQAPDADLDTLSYRLHLWGPALDTTVTGLRDTVVALVLPALEPGRTYSWTVETSDGKVRAASDTARFHTVWLVLNHAPGAAIHLRPSSKDTVQLYSSSQPVRFHWQQVTDPDRDTLAYRLHLWGPALDTTVSGLRDTAVALILTALKPGEVYTWTVETSDGKSSVASDTTDFRTGKTVLGINGSTWGMPEAFALEQNYPNPFNPSTTIRYALPQNSHVTLIVYNALGQQAAELVNGDVRAGYHEVRFAASNLASGVYFYRLEADSFVQTRRLVLVK